VAEGSLERVTRINWRWAAILLLSAVVSAQQPPAPPEPPEEDPGLKPREYSFNPVQAKSEIRAGDYYFKKGNYHAAVQRFTEATLWDSGSPEAFLRLGEAQEKLKDLAAARAAYEKYLTVADDAKTADAVKKKIAKWPDPKAPPAKSPAPTPTQK
jgi:tetratricopeptide (TPR) repeat protein